MNRPAEILAVEDNPGDVRLLREALKDTRILVNLHTVEDGLSALDFLNRRKSHAGAPRPDLILLDLNLPRKSGLEVLGEIKNDERLKRIPVVILSSSSAEDDVSRSYDAGCNCYLVKPFDLDGFIEVVESIGGFWVSRVRLPPS